MCDLIAFLPGGQVRKLFDPADRDLGALPRRASRVEVIDCGPQRGLFHVDMTPLGSDHMYCLLQTHTDYAEAVRAEQAWLQRYWIRGEQL